MFTKNKYTKWYNNICSKDYEGEVFEIHHKIPRCMGGSDEPENLVKLSPKAHFICHWLLTKMTDGKTRHKMFWAFNFMLLKPKNLKETRYYPCSRVYEIAKRRFNQHNPSYQKDVKAKLSEIAKERWKEPTPAMLAGIESMRNKKKGKPPHNKGKKGMVHSAETKAKHTAWRTGRLWFNDGQNSYFIQPEQAKPEYIRGRL